MEKITLLAIDIAKEKFQLHGVDFAGKRVLKRTLRRSELVLYITAQIAPCVIVMEACGGAHHWARTFKALGYDVKLISPQFVKPFVKGNKTDAADAEGIAIAAQQPSMRFVSIKTLEAQDIQCVHRIRSRLIADRTELVNHIRGILAEYGIVLAKGISQLRRGLPVVVDDMENNLTDKIRALCRELYDELKELDERIKRHEEEVNVIYKNNPLCQKLSQIEGIGPVTATILLTVLSEPNLFKNGRQFAAYLGLVPKQHSSGGKECLLGISKRGDTYIRSLLIHGGRSVVKRLGDKKDKRSEWARQLKERRGYNRTAVAIANKNARIAWSIVANDSYYKKAA